MRSRQASFGGALALVLSAVAFTAFADDTVQASLLRGEFDLAAQSPADASTSAEAAYYRGLAAFAVRDYPAAVATLVGVAEQHGNKPVGLRAAVVATLALSRNGDRANACQYAGIVMPLTASMSPIWRVWVEEAQRTSGCE